MQVDQAPSSVEEDSTLHRAFVADEGGTVTALDTRTGRVEAVVPIAGRGRVLGYSHAVLDHAGALC